MHAFGIRACRLPGMLLLVFGMLSSLPALADEVGVTPTSIKIGMFGPLTGAVSLWGYPINNGAIAIYNQVNASGGINGRKIEIVDEDGACDPAKTVAAVKKLIARDEVFAIHGGTCSAAVFAARDEIIDNGVPYVVMAATLDKISKPVNKYIFTTAMPGSGDGAVMAGFIASMPNVKRIAIVKHADEWADTKADALLEKLDKKFEIVANEQIDRRVTDAVTQALKLKEAKPDVVIAFTYPAETAVLLRDARKYGLDVPFLATTSVMDLLDLAERAGGVDVVKDVYVASFLTAPPGEPEAAKWGEIYQASFPHDKLQTLSFFGMSGALLIVDALKRAGKDLTREKFVQALEATKDLDAGPAFCKISMSPENHQGCPSGTMWTLADHKIVPVGPTWKAIK
jgi:branched-chain amino acid transport system substrate-binding protein